MIKKSIALIMIVVIIINCLGCFSHNQITKENTDKLEENDSVEITTMDDKIYILSNVVIEDSLLKGERYITTSIYRSYGKKTEIERIEIPIEQIKKIEVDEFNMGQTILTVVLIVGIPFAIIAIIVGTAEWKK